MELRSSGADSMADTAAGLVLEVCAREVVSGLPPGISSRSSGPGEPVDDSKTLVQYVAAWIRASGARNVQLKPWHAAGGRPEPVEPAATMVVTFSAGKQDGVRRSFLLVMATDTQGWLTSLCALHRLNLSRGVDLDGADCGWLFKPMP